MAITKEDVWEMHPTIQVLKEKLERLKRVAASINKEIEDLEDTIETLQNDYENLRKLAD